MALPNALRVALVTLLLPAAAGPALPADAVLARLVDFCRQPPRPATVLRSRRSITGPAVMRDAHRRAAVRRLLQAEGADAAAVARQVQSGPIFTRIVYSREGPLIWYYACQRHNCDGNELDILRNARSGQAWGLHYQDPQRWWEYQLGKPGARYLGHPGRRQQALLKALLCARAGVRD